MIGKGGFCRTWESIARVQTHHSKAKQQSGANTAPSEEFWKGQALLFGVLVWLCHDSDDLQRVASHRVSRSQEPPRRSSYVKRRNQFEKNTQELNGSPYLRQPWPSAAFAVASSALSSLSFRSLRKRRILRNDWRKKRSAAWFVCGAESPFRRAN